MKQFTDIPLIVALIIMFFAYKNERRLKKELRNKLRDNVRENAKLMQQLRDNIDNDGEMPI
jgi:large-conductance mechanosensitive channel